MTAPRIVSAPRHIVRPPGLHRLSGDAESWVDDNGVPVDDPVLREHLRQLRIPPAWTHVWASADPATPIQATGVDDRGRTQYRYSVAAQETSTANKFDHLLHFASTLPTLRKQVEMDLEPHRDHSSPSRLESSAVVASVIRLLDRGLFRVGNERYARENETYGLTTLRRSHISINRDVTTFDFVGKEHIRHQVSVADRPTSAVLRALLLQNCGPDDLLFATSEPPHRRHVDSVTVNSYIHTHGAVAGSAKTFRTWGATVAAAAVSAGAEFEVVGDKRRRADLVPYDAAAFLLGNTPTVARQSYVHPAAVDVGKSEDVRTAVATAAAHAGSNDVRILLAADGVQLSVLRQLSAAAE